MAVAAGKSEPGVMEAWLEGEGAGVRTEALLHAATKAGKVEVVKTLLDRRTVAVDLKDEEGDTALHVAARCTCTSTPILPHPICPHPHILRCGQHEILQLLLAAGADLGEPNLARETPMALLGNLPADITEVRIHFRFISLIFNPTSSPSLPRSTIFVPLPGNPRLLHLLREAGQHSVCHPHLPLPEPPTKAKRGGFGERGGKQGGDGHD